jgi:hypothetical protein
MVEGGYDAEKTGDGLLAAFPTTASNVMAQTLVQFFPS